MTPFSPLPCAYCDRILPLANSHVVPDFIYEGVIPEGGNAALKFEATADRSFAAAARTGVYEPLLCRECECEFNARFETPFAPAWRRIASRTSGDGISLERNQTTSGCAWRILGLDYRVVRLFLLSVLWRCHVARRPEFQNVALETAKATRIRELLRAGDPGADLDFATVIQFGEPQLRAVVCPLIYYEGGRRFVWFHWMGTEILIFLDLPVPGSTSEAYRLQPDRELVVLENQFLSLEAFRRAKETVDNIHVSKGLEALVNRGLERKE